MKTKVYALCTLLLSPVFGSAEDRLTWQSYVWENDAGGARASLVYGLPETDAIAFRARCELEPQRQNLNTETQATVYIPYDFSNQTYGAPIAVRVDGFEFTGELNAQTMQARHSEESDQAVVDLSLSHPFWNALAAGNMITLQAGTETRRYELNGSRRAVDTFLENCALIGSLVSPTVENVARAGTCLGPLGEVNFAIPKQIQIQNQSDQGLTLIAMGSGQGPYEIKAGSTLPIETYVGQSFHVTDGPGNCLEAFTVRSVDQRLFITGPGQYFGPE